MRIASADNQNGSTEGRWPRVRKIDNDEFHQSYAVAQLAVKLCQLKMEKLTDQLEKQNLDPHTFLAEAWKLIHNAREEVTRPQDPLQYFVQQHGSQEALERALERMLPESSVPFHGLCNEKEIYTEIYLHDVKLPDADTATIIKIDWKVCRSEGAFDDLFWAYWRALGEQWTVWMKGEKPRTPWMKRDAVTFWKVAHDKEKYPGGFNQLWEERGQSMLASWKRDGVPRVHFLALASGYFDFERGVKFITEQNQFDRALPWFRRFLKSRFADQNMAEKAMAEYRERAFAPGEPYSLKNEFAKWKRLEKSRLAQESRKARDKRGRVRSNRDKRLGARYKGKRIPPSKSI